MCFGVSHVSPGLLMATLASASWWNEKHSADVPLVGGPVLPHPLPARRFGEPHPGFLSVALLSAPRLLPSRSQVKVNSVHTDLLFLPPAPSHPTEHLK